MMMKVLSPGMEHRQKADLGAQVLGVSRYLQQGLGRGPEQEAEILWPVRRATEVDVEVAGYG